MLSYKMWNFHVNLLARKITSQDEKCTSSSLLHIRECSCLRHSSIADKENYIFPTPPWPYVDFSINGAFLFYSLQCLDAICTFLRTYWDFTSKNLDRGSKKSSLRYGLTFWLNTCISFGPSYNEQVSRPPSSSSDILLTFTWHSLDHLTITWPFPSLNW